MGYLAFDPHGSTLSIAVTTAASTPAQCVCSPGYPQVSGYRFYNSGTVPVFVHSGANNGVTAPTTGTAGTQTVGFPIAPGVVEKMVLGPNRWFTTICATGTATLYITPGDGGI